MPPAPPTFSMITCWPSTSDSRRPTIRPMTSVPPPAANGTTMVSGRAGQLSAAIAPSAPKPATTKAKPITCLGGIVFLRRAAAAYSGTGQTRLAHPATLGRRSALLARKQAFAAQGRLHPHGTRMRWSPIKATLCPPPGTARVRRRSRRARPYLFRSGLVHQDRGSPNRLAAALHVGGDGIADGVSD